MISPSADPDDPRWYTDAIIYELHVRSFAEQATVQHTLRKRIAARLKKEGVALASTRVAVVKREP